MEVGQEEDSSVKTPATSDVAGFHGRFLGPGLEILVSIDGDVTLVAGFCSGDACCQSSPPSSSLGRGREMHSQQGTGRAMISIQSHLRVIQKHLSYRHKPHKDKHAILGHNYASLLGRFAFEISVSRYMSTKPSKLVRKVEYTLKS